jgi:hypothetical protein
MLGALKDPQFRQDVANNFRDASFRGAVAGTLGAPVDIANMLANLGTAGYGYLGNKAGMLSGSEMPALYNEPVGGSEWIGNKMRDYGIIGGNRNLTAEVIAGLGLPLVPVAAEARIPQMDRALEQMAANYAVKDDLNTGKYMGQRGAVKNKGGVFRPTIEGERAVPFTEYFDSTTPEGKELLKHYAALAQGGLGINVTENPQILNEFIKSIYEEHVPVQTHASGVDKTLKNYKDSLNEQDIPEKHIKTILDKARTYFTTSYGTAEDPLRIGLLEGRINPSTVVDPEHIWEEPLYRDYLLKTAREDYKKMQDFKQKLADAGINTQEAPLRIPQSLEDFEKIYDKNTRLSGTVYSDIAIDPYVPSNAAPEIKALDAQRKAVLNEAVNRSTVAMEKAGVPPELINPQIGTESPFSVMELSNNKDTKAFVNEMLSGKNPTLSKAYENMETVYDLTNTPTLPFLKPDKLAQGIAEIPLDTLERMSFPEMATKASQIVDKDQGLQAAIYRLEQGKPIDKKYFLEKGVEKVIDMGPDATWFQITEPKFTQIEGNAMGHSVGRYNTKNYPLYNLGGKKAFISGEAQVYSLRNSKTGEPSLTVEIKNDRPVKVGEVSNPEITSIFGPKNSAPSVDEVLALAKHKGVSVSGMKLKHTYSKDALGEDLPEKVKIEWRSLYEQYLQNNPVKKAKGGSVERVYNDRKYT